MVSFRSRDKPSLDSLPAELVDKISEDLNLKSIRNLRLACKSLGHRLLGPRFKSFFKTQQTDLTATSLERLCQLAQHPQLCAAVRSLTVFAIVYDTSEADDLLETTGHHHVSKQDVVLITETESRTTTNDPKRATKNGALLRQWRDEARRNESESQPLVAALAAFGRLAELTVEAAFMQEPGKILPAFSAPEWHPVWIRASQVYRTTTLALARSGVAVDELNIYRDSRMCSVPTWDLNENMPALETAGFGQAGRHIKSVCLSVSTRIRTIQQQMTAARANVSNLDSTYSGVNRGVNATLLSENDPEAVSEENYPGVARLLGHMPNLERLDLHLYSTLKGPSSSYAKVFSCIAESIVLPRLRRCAFRGLYCHADSLLHFLHQHQSIHILELREIHLVSGSWASVFACLLIMPSLHEVTLQNIGSADGLVNLYPAREPQNEQNGGAEAAWKNRRHAWPCLGGELMVHTRTFCRDEMKREKFAFKNRPEGRQLGSGAFHTWITARRTDYGPP